MIFCFGDSVAVVKPDASILLKKPTSNAVAFGIVESIVSQEVVIANPAIPGIGVGDRVFFLPTADINNAQVFNVSGRTFFLLPKEKILLVEKASAYV